MDGDLCACMCVFAGIFFLCCGGCFIIIFIPLLSAGCIIASPQAGTPWHSYPVSLLLFFPLWQFTYFYQSGQEPSWHCPMPHSSGVWYFSFTFQEREWEQVWHFLVQANLQLLHVSAFKKSVTLIALISERLMCLWASDKLKEPPLMRAGLSKFRANLAFRDLTFLALSNRTSFPSLV